MKVHVINLLAQTARWTAISSQLARLGISAHRTRGVQGSALTQRETDELYDAALNQKQYHKPLTAGEIGCYASHLSVWAALLRSSDRCAAVLEDDIDIDDSLPLSMAAIDALPWEWDMIKLIGRPREKVLTRAPLCDGMSCIRYHRVPSLTGAYVVHRRGAEKLLAARRPFGRPVDVDLRHWWECDLQVFGIHPYPAKPGAIGETSTIEDRRVKPDLSMRMRKLSLQMQYTSRNWLELHRRPGMRTASVAGLEPARGDAA